MTCNHCGHEHTGPELGGICIGCPCPHVVGGFDMERVEEALLLDVLHAARDVIDEHDDQRVVAARVVPTLCERIESLRRAVFELRQAALT